MTREIVYRPLADEDLNEIYERRRKTDGVQSAHDLVTEIQDRCEALAEYSERGTPRPEIASGIRSIPFKRKAVIAYLVEEDAVVIVGIIMYGGRDLSALNATGRLP